MTQIQQFFSTDNGQRQLQNISRQLTQIHKDDKDIDDNGIYFKARQILKVINIFLKNSAEIDKHCQQNIKWIGSSLETYLQQNQESDGTPLKIDLLFSLLYRFTVEFDLSIKNDLSMELRDFQRFAKENLEKFSGEAKDQILYARQEMPVAVLKEMLNHDDIGNLRNLSDISSNLDKKVETWGKSLSTYEATVKSLQASLQSYETAFNFVGLYDGFNNLSRAKTKELTVLRRLMFLFGLLVTVPLLTELSSLLIFQEKLNALNPYLLIGTGVISLSLTILFIYFFRICLRSTDSCKAQLLQIELRKTLCQFIQSYATYSKEMKEKNPESLSKFENIIFSGIVSNEEKLPSTFDGLEQMSNFIKALKP